MICQGAVVDCDFNTEGGYFTGKVGVVNMDGTFDIEYDDGDKEAAVPRGRIRLPSEMQSLRQIIMEVQRLTRAKPVADGSRNVSISARNIFYSCPLVERAGSRTGAASVWEVPMCKVAGQAPVNHGAKAAARAQLYDAWRAMADAAVRGSMLPPPPAPAPAVAPAGGPSKRAAEPAGALERRSSRHRPSKGAE